MTNCAQFNAEVYTEQHECARICSEAHDTIGQGSVAPEPLVMLSRTEPMIRAERHDIILSKLAKRDSVSVGSLSSLLGVSEATVRCHLTELGDKGFVGRTYGGATLRDADDELPFSSKVTAHLGEKRRIGVATAGLIAPGQVVGCSGGTTVVQTMRALRGKAVRIVTNAVNVPPEFVGSPETEVWVTGGLFRGRTFELVGRIAERTLGDMNLDIALLGVDGLSLEGGLTTYNQTEAHVSHEFVARAQKVWVVADGSKLGLIKPAVMAPLAKLTRLVTDTGASVDFVAHLRREGIEVVLA